PLSDPRLCVPVSRRVCPCREGSSLCREISARGMPSVDRNQAESVTTCDREHLGHCNEQKNAMLRCHVTVGQDNTPSNLTPHFVKGCSFITLHAASCLSREKLSDSSRDGSRRGFRDRAGSPTAALPSDADRTDGVPRRIERK